MKSSLEKLHKYFRLEVERNFDNHAVVGGLERMLEPWAAEARSEQVPEDLIQLIFQRIRDYPRLSPVSRSEVLEGLWTRIQREEGLDPKPLVPEKTPKREMTKASSAPYNSTADTSDQAATIIEMEETLEIEAEKVSKSDKGKEDRSEKRILPPIQEDEDLSLKEPAALDAPITVLPGVGPKHAQTLARLDLYTLRDMLYYFPRRYDDYSRLKPINRLIFGEEVTVIGTVQNIHTRSIRDGRSQVVEAVLNDGSGALRLNWFNQAWVGKRLRKSEPIVVSGKIDQYLGRLVMNSPEWEPLEQQQLSTNRIVPVYPLTASMTQRWLRKIMNSVVEYWAPRVREILPFEFRRSAGLISLAQALLQIHFPDSWESLDAARQRLAFDEIFLLQMGVLQQKREWQERTARSFNIDTNWYQNQTSQLPFTLTNAQQSAISDVFSDLSSGRPMNRLLQGDVGSGKTLVAAMAIAAVVREGAQTALMAPTSILAEQHYRSLTGILAANPEIGEVPPVNNEESLLLSSSQIRLMVGATPEAEKREIRTGLEDGSIKLVIGTHALIEDPVSFSDLELVIIDEQHRFGVEQRAALRSKGANPHLLVMTATPIPRSLALTVYGDLDLSVMDEMPPGRQEISTHIIPPRERERAYNFIRSQAAQGNQSFIIYPLVEESEKSEAKAAVEEHKHLQTEVFPDFSLGLLHGRLKPEEKEAAMTLFRDLEYDILVSTSVVEVGVDIPNATVMMIEGANRFGLAQLHQFRGRVGRGTQKSYCFLIPDSSDAIENERLQAMISTNDGFVLAEKDLEQRGPGQFLGTRQSGFNELQMANLTDVHLIEKARRHAQLLFEENPHLSGTEYAALNEALQRFWNKNEKGDIS